MTLKRDKVEAALRRKGFQQKDGDHIHFIYYTVEGKKTPVRTMLSRGSKTSGYRGPILSAGWRDSAS